eukprot:6188312-Pleurochrysis_carterae.AAC.2
MPIAKVSPGLPHGGAVFTERLGQVCLSLGLDVSGRGYFDTAVVAHVDVHPKEVFRLVPKGQLEAISKDAQVVVRLHRSGVGHPAVFHVQHQVDAMSVKVLLVEVARFELRLGEPLYLHKLFLGRAMPDPTRVCLAVGRFEKFPYDWYAAIVEEALVRRRSNINFAVVALELSLQVGGFDVELPDA